MKPDNPPVFARPASTVGRNVDVPSQDGISLRDYFAGQYLTTYDPGMAVTPARIAVECYEIADALLAEREKQA